MFYNKRFLSVLLYQIMGVIVVSVQSTAELRFIGSGDTGNLAALSSFIIIQNFLLFLSQPIGIGCQFFVGNSLRNQEHSNSLDIIGKYIVTAIAASLFLLFLLLILKTNLNQMPRLLSDENSTAKLSTLLEWGMVGLSAISINVVLGAIMIALGRVSQAFLAQASILIVEVVLFLLQDSLSIQNRVVGLGLTLSTGSCSGIFVASLCIRRVITQIMRQRLHGSRMPNFLKSNILFSLPIWFDISCSMAALLTVYVHSVIYDERYLMASLSVTSSLMSWSQMPSLVIAQTVNIIFASREDDNSLPKIGRDIIRFYVSIFLPALLSIFTFIAVFKSKIIGFYCSDEGTTSILNVTYEGLNCAMFIRSTAAVGVGFLEGLGKGKSIALSGILRLLSFLITFSILSPLVGTPSAMAYASVVSSLASLLLVIVAVMGVASSNSAASPYQSPIAILRHLLSTTSRCRSKARFR